MIPRFEDLLRACSPPPTGHDHAMAEGSTTWKRDQEMTDAPPSIVCHSKAKRPVKRAQDSQGLDLDDVRNSLAAGAGKEVEQMHVENAFNYVEVVREDQRRTDKIFTSFSSLNVQPTSTPNEILWRSQRTGQIRPEKPQASPNWKEGMNPFYQPQLDFEDGTAFFQNLLNQAHTQITAWTDEWEPSAFRQHAATAKGKASMERTCKALFFATEFLHLGRAGWDFSWWDVQMFRDAVVLANGMYVMLGKLACYEGCGWLKSQGIDHVQVMLKKLIEMAAEAEKLEDYGAQLEAELEAALANN